MSKPMVKKEVGVEATEKKEKIWLVPAVSLVIAVLLISFILFRNNIGDIFSGSYNRPFTRYSEKEVQEKMTNDEDFILVMYAEDDVASRQYLLGSSVDKNGDGTIKQWFNKYDVQHGAMWVNEGAEADDSGVMYHEIDTYINALTTLVEDAGIATSLKWRDKIYEGGKNSSISATEERPGIPSTWFFLNGELQTILNGNQKLSTISEVAKISGLMPSDL